jgi:hypothetical protein
MVLIYFHEGLFNSTPICTHTYTVNHGLCLNIHARCRLRAIVQSTVRFNVTIATPTPLNLHSCLPDCVCGRGYRLVLNLVSHLCDFLPFLPASHFSSLLTLPLLPFLCQTHTQGDAVRKMIDNPPHLATEPHLYSLLELEGVKVGNYVPRLESLLVTCAAHVENCVRCAAKGYICEVCNSDEVIFPFDASKTTQCPTCKTVSHAKCWARCKTGCPKCARIEKYRLSKLNRPPLPPSSPATLASPRSTSNLT